MHRLRSACRRLRSELRALEPLVETQWRERTEGELKWLAGLLGDARDPEFCLPGCATARELEGQIADPASLALFSPVWKYAEPGGAASRFQPSEQPVSHLLKTLEDSCVLRLKNQPTGRVAPCCPRQRNRPGDD